MEINENITLHEAIREVLLQSGKPCSSIEIADQINSLKLYHRKDGKPIPSAQIKARIKNYNNIFYTESGKIFLIDYNSDKATEEQILKVLRHIRNRVVHHGVLRQDEILKIFLQFVLIRRERQVNYQDVDNLLIKSTAPGKVNERIFSEIEQFFHSEFEHLFDLIETHQNANQAIKVICEAFLKEIHILSEIPQASIKRISNLILENDIESIDVVDDSVPIYILEILDTDKNFKKIKLTFNTINTEVLNLAELVFKCTDSVEFIKTHQTTNDSDLGLCVSIGRRRNLKDKSELDAIQKQYSRLKSNSIQVLVGVNSVLYHKGYQEQERRFMLHEHNPTTILQLPFNSKVSGIKSLAHIEFDHIQRNRDIFVGDFVSGESLSETEILKIVSKRKEAYGYSLLITKQQIEENLHNWNPSIYINVHYLSDLPDGAKKLEYFVSEIIRGKHLKRDALYPEGEVKYITTKDLSEDKIRFELKDSVLAIDRDELTGNINRVPKGAVLITLIGNSLKANVFNLDIEVLADQHILALQCTDEILPEFLVYSLKSELATNQINSFRIQGVGIPRISRSDLLNIRLVVPPLDEQRKILLEKSNLEKPTTEDKLDTEEFNFIATLKHTLKQPLTTLSEDFNVLQAYLAKKSKEGVISLDELMVEVFEGEDESALKKHSLIATMNRCQRMINDAHDHLNKSEQLLRIDTLKPKFSLSSLKQFFTKLEKDNPSITFDIKGRDYTANLDEYSIRILFDNLIENAIKHGFQDVETPKIHINLELEKQKFEAEYIKISFLNNGKPLSNDMDIDKFLRKRVKTKGSAGDGYGGFLINKIIKLHQGQIEINTAIAKSIDEYNVCFEIYLPKI